MGGKMRTTEEVNNQFLEAKGEIVFSSVFKDDDKKRVLETYYGLCSNIVANCLVSNIVLPADEEKLNSITCLVNQVAGGSEYKVCTR